MSIRGIEQYLGCDIIRGAANGLLSLPRVLNECREAKVANLDVHVPVEEQIAELEVAMDDLVCVHVVAGTDELDQEKAGLWLGEAATAAKHVHEGTRGA